MHRVANEDLVETVMALPTPASMFERIGKDDFRVLAINDAVRRLYKTDADPVGRTLDQLVFSTNAGGRLREIYSACCEQRTTTVSEVRFLLRDNSIIYTSVTAVPIIEDGEVTKVLSSSIDVTELVMARRAEAEELRRLASALIPVCAWCSSVRTGNRWVPVQDYVRDRQPAPVLCPECRDSAGQ